LATRELGAEAVIAACAVREHVAVATIAAMRMAAVRESMRGRTLERFVMSSSHGCESTFDMSQIGASSRSDSDLSSGVARRRHGSSCGKSIGARTNRREASATFLQT
jgi:hypothetical protein